MPGSMRATRAQRPPRRMRQGRSDARARNPRRSREADIAVDRAGNRPRSRSHCPRAATAQSRTPRRRQGRPCRPVRRPRVRCEIGASRPRLRSGPARRRHAPGRPSTRPDTAGQADLARAAVPESQPGRAWPLTASSVARRVLGEADRTGHSPPATAGARRRDRKAERDHATGSARRPPHQDGTPAYLKLSTPREPHGTMRRVRANQLSEPPF